MSLATVLLIELEKLYESFEAKTPTLTPLVLREKIFLDLSLTPSEARCIFLESDSFSAKSLNRILRYHYFCEIIFRKCA